MRGLLFLLLCFSFPLISAANRLPSLDVNSCDNAINNKIHHLFNLSEHRSANSLLPVTPKHDTVLVAAPDGTIYFLDINSRKVLWSFDSGTSIYSSFQASNSHEAAEPNVLKSDNFFIDCGEDWELYLHQTGFNKVKLRSVEEILSYTPYVSADGGILSGSKKTTTFLVDAISGVIVRTLRPDDFPMLGDQAADDKYILPRKDADDCKEPIEVDSDVSDQLLYILRTDYALKYTSRTGKVLWYVMFADVKASFQCLEVDNISVGIFSRVDNLEDNQKRQSGCQMRPAVYRVRDISSLDSLLLTARLPYGHDSRLASLHSLGFFPQNIPIFKSVDTYLNDEGRVVLPLPPPEVKENGIVDIYKGGSDVERMHVDAEILAMNPLWPLFFLVVILMLFAFVLSLKGRKTVKLNKPDENQKLQVLLPKKKKGRKSGTHKNGISSEKRQESFIHDNLVGDANGILHFQKSERRLQSSSISYPDGQIQGRIIGKLFISHREIAKGSNGTVVLEGFYDGRPVAVKRLVQAHHDVALKEIQNLIASDQHQNIVRWYGVEYDQDFVYLSLERCTCSLHDLIVSCSISSSNVIVKDGKFSSSLINYNDGSDFELLKPNGFPSLHLLKLMRDIVSGLAHLHEIGIIHRDLKPQNVLILKERRLRAKISDMGISKRLAGDMSSLTKHATGYGSSGWQAPEQLCHDRQTLAVDLFCLGCVLFFCITGGGHPFGENLERDINIVNNRKDLFLIENIPEAVDLISRLLNPNPVLRPKAAYVLHHPIFWSPDTRLSFLRDASDRVELEDRESNSELLRALESTGGIVFGGKWDDKIESAFINDIGRYRRYKFDCVRDLLRVIRNKLNHYRELPKEIQEILGQVPVGFDSYFSCRFPKLVMEVYKVFQIYCGEEDFLIKYFKGSGQT